MNTNEYIEKWRGMMNIFKFTKEKPEFEFKFRIIIDVDRDGHVIGELFKVVPASQGIDE